MKTALSVIGLLLLVQCCWSAAVRADEGEGDRYTIHVTADLEMKLSVGTRQLKAVAEFEYSWRPVDGQQELVLHEMSANLAMGGRTMMDAVMRRDSMTTTQNGESTKVALEDADDEVRELLTQCFDSPLYRVKLDDHGVELERKDVAGPIARAVLGRNGVVENARFFHAPFYADKREWTAEASMAASEGRLWKGELKYVKSDKPAAEDAPHLVRVDVSGELSADGEDGIENSITKLSGHQVYDTRLSRWVSGIVQGPQEFTVTKEGVEGEAKGEFVVTFKRVAK